jgi:MFS family permease
MHGAGERYILPLVILAGATLPRVAAIAALPPLAGALVQCLAANLADSAGRRKSMFVGSALVQALTWLPASIAVFLPGDAGYWLMLLSFALYLAAHNFSIPPWSSVMGNLVPPAVRGRWFGFRNLLVGAGIVASFTFGGEWLQWCEVRPGLWGLSGRNTGFLALFALAMAARLASTGCLAKMFEPSYRRAASDRFTLAQFIRRMPYGHFGRFTIYVTALMVGVGLAGPFFWWYMFGPLKLSTREFAVLGTAHLAVHFGSQPLWGRLADRIGNKAVLAIGGVGIALIPVIWLVSTNYAYLLVAQMYDGCVWGAFAIASGNYLYDTCTPPKRARCTAYYNLFLAAGGLVGAFLGAAIAPLAAKLGMAPFTLLLVVSAAGRMLPNLTLLPLFADTRIAGIKPGVATPTEAA